MKFIEGLNSMTGMTFRLPSEEEWEFAAKGGNKSQGYRYSGSDNVSAITWHEGNSEEMTHEVGSKLSNELGLFDMSGNVWELTSGEFTDRYGSPSTGDITRRGGAMLSPVKICRVTTRKDIHKDERIDNQGLRLAL